MISKDSHISDGLRITKIVKKPAVVESTLGTPDLPDELEYKFDASKVKSRVGTGIRAAVYQELRESPMLAYLEGDTGPKSTILSSYRSSINK